MIPKHVNLFKIRNQIGRYTTAVGGGWYRYVLPGNRKISLLLLKRKKRQL